MEWIERLNSAVNYIEDNLTKEIELDEIAKLACTSHYNFQRMFSYMTGTTLSEYIRRRRMTLAALDLQISDDRIIDIALKYGYSSPTAFNRAFQSIHGIAPSMVKKGDSVLKSFQPISFKMIIEGAEGLNYRIVKKEEFRVVGISYPLDKEFEKNLEMVPRLWIEAGVNGTIQNLVPYMENEPHGLLGISVGNENEDGKFFIAVSSDKETGGRFEEYIVPKSTWAVFSNVGTHESMQELMKKIWTEWIPNSAYEYAEGPDIEVYMEPDPNNSRIEMWLPVKLRRK